MVKSRLLLLVYVAITVFSMTQPTHDVGCFYIEVGFLEAVKDALEDALTVARNKGNDEIVAELGKKLDTYYFHKNTPDRDLR
jgi:hypothetical protein